MEWSLWYFRNRAKPTCELCRDDQAKGLKEHCPGIEWKEKCPLDHVPKLAQENVHFINIFIRVYPGLFNGMGGVNYQSIDTVFDTFGIHGDLRQVYFDKCLVCLKAIFTNQKNEQEHAKHKAQLNRKR